jgi:hypothetical protein
MAREDDNSQGIVEIERLARLDATTGYGIRITDEWFSTKTTRRASVSGGKPQP